jgi:hypothetical protein
MGLATEVKRRQGKSTRGFGIRDRSHKKKRQNYREDGILPSLGFYSHSLEDPDESTRTVFRKGFANPGRRSSFGLWKSRRSLRNAEPTLQNRDVNVNPHFTTNRHLMTGLPCNSATKSNGSRIPADRHNQILRIRHPPARPLLWSRGNPAVPRHIGLDRCSRP